ncbi:MAG: SDR family oxidoreductase [Chloroflexi bacterium]|nr:SDR family oxidoreductase [Chloroflexota bacterium]
MGGLSLQGQVAIITGGTGGLGPAVLGAFLKSGAQVVAPVRERAKLDALRPSLGEAEARLRALEADVTQEESVAAFTLQVMRDLGRIDILVNLVGGFAGGASLAETATADFQRMLDLNLKSVFLCSRAVLPQMLKQGRGKIISVASRAGLKGAARVGPYSAAKAGVILLTESLSEEVKHLGLNVNCILPSVIDTEANRKAMPKADFSRWVRPEEIASVLLFLASDAARAIQGAAIPVYGRA